MKILTWKKENLIAFGGVLLGALIGIAIPVWQNYLQEKTELKFEVVSIDKKISNDYSLVLKPFPKLKPLVNYVWDLKGEDAYYGSDKLDEVPIKPDQLTRLYELAEDGFNERLSEMEMIKTNIRQIGSLTLERITFMDIYNLEDLNYYLPEKSKIDWGNHLSILYSVVDGDELYNENEIKNSINFANQKLTEFPALVDKTFDDEKKELESTLPKINEIQEEADKKYSIFTLTGSLTNTGKSNISMRQSALLRVYIAKSHYVDIDLSVEDFEAKSNLISNSTGIVTFNSQRISTYDDLEESLINKHWGQNVKSRVFIEDVNGDIHVSNPVIFAEGIYQRQIFDRLIREASREIYYE